MWLACQHQMTFRLAAIDAQISHRGAAGGDPHWESRMSACAYFSRRGPQTVPQLNIPSRPSLDLHTAHAIHKTPQQRLRQRQGIFYELAGIDVDKERRRVESTCLAAATTFLPSSLVSGSDGSRTQNTQTHGTILDPAHNAGRPTGIDEIHLRHGQTGQTARLVRAYCTLALLVEQWGRPLPRHPKEPH